MGQFPALYGVAGLAGILLLSVIVTRLVISLRLLAVPNKRSSHQQPVPTSGGVSIWLAVGLGGILIAVPGGGWSTQILWTIAAGSILAIGGLLDDLGKAKSFRAKLAFQIFGVAILFAGGIHFERIYLPVLGIVDLGLLGYLLAALWIIGFTNAFNFMDGIDGIAGGTAIIAAGFITLIAVISDFNEIAGWAAVVAVATLGFLLFNFPKARIFMGDVGSQFLGFLIAALGIVLANATADGTYWIFVPILYFHFIFDTCFTFFRRLRAGEPVTQAHRSHLYQRLVSSGCSHPTVSGLHFLFSVLLGGLAMLVLVLPDDTQFLLFLPALILCLLYLRAVSGRARPTE